MRSTLTTASFVAAALLAFPASAALPTHSPNSIKYADTGIHNATGRSGSAAIEARALLGRDGNTSIDVTTGSFESGGASGHVDKLQLRAQNGNRTLLRNYDALGGATVSVLSNELAPHQAVEVQSNVSGIDGDRTDVVTATATVARRPDLAVQSFGTPRYAYAGFPTLISADVREKNGDAGARANCRLLADGVQVDEAAGIWVDAGGTVTCSFSPVLAATGDKQLQVVVDGENPGDWDDSNNTTSKTLHVVNSMGTWTASAWQTDSLEEGWGHTDYGWATQDTSLYWKQADDEIRFSATLPLAVDFQDLTFDSTKYTDGRQIEMAIHGGLAYPVEYDGQKCAEIYERYDIVSVCTANGLTQIAEQSGGSSQVYISTWAMRFAGSNDGPSYVIRMPRQPNGGAVFGDTVSLDITLNANGTLYEAHPYIVLTGYDNPPEVTDQCTYWSGGSQCSHISNHTWGKSGSDSNP